MSSYKKLRQFSAEELLLNEEETRTVLKFIFKPTDYDLIDLLPMTDYLRGFAQGLLVEAIDASHAVGYVYGLFTSVKNPVKGTLKILKNFGKKASQNWFKHASVHDLQNAKVYNFVLDYIAQYFREHLRLLLTQSELDEKPGAFFAYKAPSSGIVKWWG